MRTLLRAAAAVVALAATTAVAVATPAPAWAHDVLISTSPADGSTVASSPASVVMTFDEPALAVGTRLVVVGPAGTVVSAGRARCVDTTVTQDLAGALPAGHYDVQWRVTSADGHPVSGRFAYTTSGLGRGAVTGVSQGEERARADDGGSGSWWALGALALVVVLAGVVAVGRRRGGAGASESA